MAEACAAACHAGSRVQSLVPAGPTIRVEKVALFRNPGDTFSSTATAIEIKYKLKIYSSKRKGVPASLGNDSA
jgi:hypothetical protein